MWPFKRKPPTKAARPLVVKNYQSARIDRLTAGWVTEAKHPDQLIKENLKILRARSREQYANNDYMARFVGLTRSNVVGPKGIKLQATCKDERGELDKVDNDAIEKAFSVWGEVGNCDVTGQLSFADIQRLFIATVVTDGEFLAREVTGGPHNYQLALIDTELLDVDHNRKDLKNGHKICFSIEMDRSNRPIAYYLRDDTGEYSYAGKKYTRVPAKQIIHCFVPERVGQKRGIPAASTAMMRMNMLSGYEDAAITAARVGASKMGFFTSQAGDGYMGDDEGEDGSIISDVEPGIFEQLPEGMDFKPFDPDYPHQQFGEFVKTCLRGLSSGLGVSYNSLSNDLEGVNYSSIRAGVLEDREAWKAMQEWMIQVFMKRVYRNWLPQALIHRKVISVYGNPLPESKTEKFLDHTWQPRRWAWVDPLKDTQASVMAIGAGLKSRAEVIRDMGRDPEEVWTELEAEKERLADLLQEAEPMEVSDSEEV